MNLARLGLALVGLGLGLSWGADGAVAGAFLGWAWGDDVVDALE